MLFQLLELYWFILKSIYKFLGRCLNEGLKVISWYPLSKFLVIWLIQAVHRFHFWSIQHSASACSNYFVVIDSDSPSSWDTPNSFHFAKLPRQHPLSDVWFPNSILVTFWDLCDLDDLNLSLFVIQLQLSMLF